MTEDLFGRLVSTGDVELAAVEALRTWIPSYLTDLEIKRGLQKGTIKRPPTAESYHGGVDFESWIGGDLPEVMVVVDPEGPPEISASAGYTQAYSVEIGCLWVGSGSALAERAEDEARLIAYLLGDASMLLVQQTALGGIAGWSRMTSAPKVTLPNPDNRSVAQVVTGFVVWVNQIVEQFAGPTGPTPEESPGEEPFEDAPLAKDGEITVKAEPTANPL